MLSVVYNVTATKNDKTIYAIMSKELIDDTMELHNIDSLAEMKNVLRLEMIIETKREYAIANNISCHYDTNFNATNLSLVEFQKYTELFTTENIINNDCEIVVTEIEKD